MARPSHTGINVVRPSLVLALVIGLILALSACGGGGDEPVPSLAPTPDIEATVQAGVEATIIANPTTPPLQVGGTPTPLPPMDAAPATQLPTMTPVASSLTPTPLPSLTTTPIAALPTMLPSPTPATIPTSTPFTAPPLVTFSGRKDYFQTSPFTVQSSSWRIDWDVSYWGFDDYDWNVALWSIKDGKNVWVKGLVDRIYDRRQNGSVLLHELLGTFYLVIHGPSETLGSWEIKIFDGLSLVPTPTPYPSPTATPKNEGNTPKPEEKAAVYENQTYGYRISKPVFWVVQESVAGLQDIWFNDTKSSSYVWVGVREIDPDEYPNLNSYIALWKPGPSSSWDNYSIYKKTRVRHTDTLEAQEFRFRYSVGNNGYVGVLSWFIIGKYRVSVVAHASSLVWTDPDRLSDRQVLLDIVHSFDPFQFTSDSFGYSVAHPVKWQSYTDTNCNYAVADPETTAQMCIQVHDASGYSDSTAYGSDLNLQQKDRQSARSVFLLRRDKAFRIEYTSFDEARGGLIQGAIAIFLSGENAILVDISSRYNEWAEVERVADDVFLMVSLPIDAPSPAPPVPTAVPVAPAATAVPLAATAVPPASSWESTLYGDFCSNPCPDLICLDWTVGEWTTYYSICGY